MLGKFIKQIILLSLPIILGIALYAWKNAAYFPDPMFSNNLSLNMKLQKGIVETPGGVDILSIGSSMNLNNLSSKAVKEKWPGSSYFNFGFWGCDIVSIQSILPLLIERKKPSRVIITTNTMDFTGELSFDSTHIHSISETLDTGSKGLRYLKNWNAPFYLRNMESNRIRFTDRGNYEFMGVDENGGAGLQVPEDRISKARYDKTPVSSDQLKEKHYGALENLASFLATKNIELIVLQSPFREGILNQEHEQAIQAHTNRLRTILQKYHFALLDGTDRSWEDDLYADSSHLNEEGAYLFSRYCFDKL